jgi:hypothetical protein
VTLNGSAKPSSDVEDRWLADVTEPLLELGEALGAGRDAPEGPAVGT